MLRKTVRLVLILFINQLCLIIYKIRGVQLRCNGATPLFLVCML